MLDRTLTLRSEKASAQAEWHWPRLARDGAGAITPGGFPSPIRGDIYASYNERKHNNSAFRNREKDPILPHNFEARINRRLGFKARYAGAAFVYWRHTPIMRLVSGFDHPNHIFITGYHIGTAVAYGRAAGSQLRAFKALNPVLDYLMTGVRIEADGVHIHGRGVTPWPDTARKPGLYIPVAGRGASVPYWTARRVDLVSNSPVSFPGGVTWADCTPFPVGPSLASYDEETTDLEGLT